MILLGVALVVGSFGLLPTEDWPALLIGLLYSRALIVELHGTLVPRARHAVFATLQTLWAGLITLLRCQCTEIETRTEEAHPNPSLPTQKTCLATRNADHCLWF